MRTPIGVLRCTTFLIRGAVNRIIAPRCTSFRSNGRRGVSRFIGMATNDLAGGQAASTSPNQNFKGNAREFSTSERDQRQINQSQGGNESSKMPYVVGHDKDKKMFYIQIASSDGTEREEETAVLEYEWIRPNLVDLYHTEVPPAFRGRGVAKLLAKEALDHFSGQPEVKMRLTCTYLVKYVQDNPLPRYTCCLEA